MQERVIPKATQSSFIRDLGDVVTNVPWLILFVLGIATLSYVSIRNGCFAFYFKYYVGDQTVLGMKFSANGMLGALALYAKFRKNGKYCPSQVFATFLPFGTIPIRAAKRSSC